MVSVLFSTPRKRTFKLVLLLLWKGLVWYICHKFETYSVMPGALSPFSKRANLGGIPHEIYLVPLKSHAATSKLPLFSTTRIIKKKIGIIYKKTAKYKIQENQNYLLYAKDKYVFYIPHLCFFGVICLGNILNVN